MEIVLEQYFKYKLLTIVSLNIVTCALVWVKRLVRQIDKSSKRRALLPGITRVLLQPVPVLYPSPILFLGQEHV